MKTENKIMSPHQFILYNALTYPGLYSGNYEDTKLKLFNHYFNVIGNGIGNTEEKIIQHISYKPFDEQDAERYVRGEELYFNGDASNENDSYILESELKSRVDKENYVSVSSLYEEYPSYGNPLCNLYPNFKKEYSVVWKMPLKIYPDEWIEVSLWFYTKCKEYFLSEPTDYYYGFPGEDRTEQEAIHYMTNRFNAEYGNTWNYEKIAEDYGITFSGNVRDFLIRNWNNELTRINQFLDETIELIQIELSRRVDGL